MLVFTLAIHDLKVTAFVGLLPEEKLRPNDFLVNVQVDVAVGQLDDQLRHTLDYAQLYQTVLSVMQIPCDLLETKVWQLSQAISVLSTEIRQIRLEITKLNPISMPACRGASVGLKLPIAHQHT